MAFNGLVWFCNSLVLCGRGGGWGTIGSGLCAFPGVYIPISATSNNQFSICYVRHLQNITKYKFINKYTELYIILSLDIEKCFEMYQKCLKYPPNITQCTLYIHVLLMNNLGYCSHTHQVQFILKQSIEYTSTNGDYKLCTLSHTYIYTYYMYVNMKVLQMV